MAAPAFPRDERIGLIAAIALHAAVLAALLLGQNGTAPPPKSEPVTITISDDIAPTSTAPRPAAAAPDVAPQIGEPAPPAPEPAPPLDARPAIEPPTPAPTRAQPVKQAPPTRSERAERSAPPKAARAAAPSRSAASASKAAPATPPKQAGGSRIGADFLKGMANAPATPSHGQPAAAIGPAQRASLSSAIARQLKPNWSAPQGADADLLVTTLTWDLDASGRLTGKPRVVGQQGITDANRSQAARHAEQAIRAVELAAPFQLPAQYYAGWRHVAAFRFDRKLSQ